MLTQPLALQRQPEQVASAVAVPLTFGEFGQGDSPWCTISFHCNGDAFRVSETDSKQIEKASLFYLAHPDRCVLLGHAVHPPVRRLVC